MYLPMWLMACQTIGPRDLKIGMYMQRDQGAQCNLVSVRTPVGGGGTPEAAGRTVDVPKQIHQKYLKDEYFNKL